MSKSSAHVISGRTVQHHPPLFPLVEHFSAGAGPLGSPPSVVGRTEVGIFGAGKIVGHARRCGRNGSTDIATCARASPD